MGHEYALDWLDQMVNELDPQRTEPNSLNEHQSRAIVDKAAKEEKRLILLFKQFVFQEQKNRQIKNLVNQYISAAASLMKTASTNLNQSPKRADNFRHALKSILSCLNGVSAFIAYRYRNLVDRDMPLGLVPIDLGGNNLRGLNDHHVMKRNPKLSELVVAEMSDTFGDDRGHEITIRKLDYQASFSQAVACANNTLETATPFDELEIILIERNFNSPRFIKYLVAKFTDFVDNSANSSLVPQSLSFLQKTFNQIPVMKDLIFSGHFDDLSLTINAWFIQEIDFQSNKSQAISTKNYDEKSAKKYVRKTSDKIVCNLTVDQLSLLFKAADLSNIIAARSLSAIFQSVAPYLSTPHRTEISPGSLRVKSYSVEERDKALLIEIMTRLIDQIKGL